MDSPRDPGAGAPADGLSETERLKLVASMLDLLPDFFYIHNYEMRFIYANRWAADYFGVERDQLIGQRLEDVDRDKEQAKFFAEVCRRIMREGRARLTDNLPYRRPDGSRGVLRQHDIPFRDPRTGEMMLLGLSRDVTAERDLEAERVRAAALEREMSIARDIQRSLLPSREPPGKPASIALAGHSEPALYAGGDFFDWFLTGGGQLAVVIGDVTGHGIGPALLAAECRAYARVLLESLPPGEAFRRLQELLEPDLPDGRFITLAAALIDTRSHQLRVLSAGHGPILVRRANGGSVASCPVDGPPLGVPVPWGCDEPAPMDFNAGDVLVLTSDGVMEAMDAQRSQFGIERLRDAVARENGGAHAIMDRLRSLVRTHIGDGTAGDDVTIVCAGRLS